jgi:hypothetical protein
MTSALIGHARAVLDGRTPVPPGQQAHVASFLARQALEDIVLSLCERRIQSLDYPVAMRSRLIVLGMLSEPQTATAIEVAWIGLSAACHHHAYELAPTAAEVRHLINIVAGLPTD